MNRREREQKKEILKNRFKNNLSKDIELKVNENKMEGTLIFGAIHRNNFVDLSSHYSTGQIPVKIFNDMGFYINYKGANIRVDLNKDNVYEKEGKLVIEKV
jgi:hypothetical protein